MGNLKMYVSVLLLVISTVGGGVYKLAVGPIKSQLKEQQLIIQEQAKELGRLKQLIESTMIQNTELRSELKQEKERSNLLELGLKEAKVNNDKMSELVDKQNKKVKVMLDSQKKNKEKILIEQNKAKEWKNKHLALSKRVKSLPMGDCEKSAYLYDEYRKYRNSP